jgi:hypothetical protein
MSARAISRGIPTTVVALLLIAVIFALYTAQRASATHQPADKAAAAADNTETFSGGTATELLETKIRTSKTADLMLHVSLECEIFTQHIRQGATSFNQANGQVRVWVEVDDVIVPIESFSEPPQGPGTPIAGEDTVSFCQRNETFNKTDTNPGPALIGEFENWFQTNRDANSFNWVRLNTGSGIHRVEVVANFIEQSAATTGDFSQAQAAVGNRMLIVDVTHMSNDILVSNPGSS